MTSYWWQALVAGAAGVMGMAMVMRMGLAARMTSMEMPLSLTSTNLAYAVWVGALFGAVHGMVAAVMMPMMGRMHPGPWSRVPIPRRSASGSWPGSAGAEGPRPLRKWWCASRPNSGSAAPVRQDEPGRIAHGAHRVRGNLGRGLRCSRPGIVTDPELMEFMRPMPGSPLMIRASWNGTVLAESDATVVVEGNHYFPREDVNLEYLQDSPAHTRCPWKGTASYYHVVVEEETNPDAAWYYPDPSPAAAKIAGRIAFWHGVRVERIGSDGAPRRSVLSRLMGR